MNQRRVRAGRSIKRWPEGGGTRPNKIAGKKTIGERMTGRGNIWGIWLLGTICYRLLDAAANVVGVVKLRPINVPEPQRNPSRRIRMHSNATKTYCCAKIKTVHVLKTHKKKWKADMKVDAGT